MNFKQSILLSCCAIPCVSTSMAQITQQPNVVLILLDDVGYSDFSCYGSEIPTPNIDKLAEEGIRMRTFYNQARSAPTRASLMTGLYPHQVGNGALGRVKGYPDAYQGYPNEKNYFIPEVLETAGYFSFVTGKWHLGHPQGVTPIARGFDRSLNAPFGGYYYSDDTTLKKNKRDKTRDHNLYLNDEELAFDDPRLPDHWYSTELWTSFGLKFVDEAIDADKPFFWYLAHNGAHFPLQAPNETVAKYRGKYMEGWEAVRNRRFERQKELGIFDESTQVTPRNPKVPDWNSLTQQEKVKYDHQMAIYAAVIEHLDKSVGEVVKHLKEQGVYENTLIILLSDNGGNGEPGIEGVYKGPKQGEVNSNVFLGAAWADVANTPYFLYKHHGHEGGCNTSMIISYPNAIKPELKGSINEEAYGHVIDIMPTLVELTGAKYGNRREEFKVPPMEGCSLLPLLQGKSLSTEERPVIMEHEGNKMIRMGWWKAVQEYGVHEKWRLYNLKDDPTEMNDLSESNPKKLKELTHRYNKLADHIGVEDKIKYKIGRWYSPIEEYLKQN